VSLRKHSSLGDDQIKKQEKDGDLSEESKHAITGRRCKEITDRTIAELRSISC